LVWWVVGRLAGFDSNGLAVSVVSAPERYLTALAYAFLILNVLATLFVGRRVAKATGNPAYGIIAQSGLLLLGTQFPRVYYLSAEVGVLPVTMLLLAVLAPEFFRTGELRTRCTAVAAGVIEGVGLAIKVTMLPVAALLLSLRSIRLIIIAVGVMTVSAIASVT